MKIWPKKEMQMSLKQMKGFSIHYKKLGKKKKLQKDTVLNLSGWKTKKLKPPKPHWDRSQPEEVLSQAQYK